MNKAFIEAYYQTYNQESPDALAVFYHSDVKLHSPQGTIEGVDGILSVYREIIRQFYDQMHPVSIDIKDNVAQVVLIDKFTAKEPVDDFMGHAFATGESFEMTLRGSYRVLDDKFVEITIEPATEAD